MIIGYLDPWGLSLEITGRDADPASKSSMRGYPASHSIRT